MIGLPCLQSDAVTSAPTISKTSTVEEVFIWAREVGLDEGDAGILKREKISGAVLFNLTDAELVKIGLVLGPRKTLVAAVDRFRRPPGTRHCTMAG